MGFSREVYWSGLPFPSLGDLSKLGIEPASPVSALAGGFFTTEALKHLCHFNFPGLDYPLAFLWKFSFSTPPVLRVD